MKAPDLILAFVDGRHVPALVFAAPQASFGDVKLTGGSAADTISTAGFGYNGFAIGLMAFKGADVYLPRSPPPVSLRVRPGPAGLWDKRDGNAPAMGRWLCITTAPIGPAS
jgi:hypothetical protein